MATCAKALADVQLVIVPVATAALLGFTFKYLTCKIHARLKSSSKLECLFVTHKPLA